MKLLIIGYSDLVRRKILPTVLDNKRIKSFDIASKSKKNILENKLDKVYEDYGEALKDSTADTVYISLPNSMHYEYSSEALNSNRDVIVDKPAITESWQLEKLYALSKRKKLTISMSSVFNYHKAWKKFKSISLKNNESGVLSVSFTIPELSSENIRMSKKLGGGAINDMGIYASTVGYLFWDRKIQDIKINEYKKNKITTGFTVLANYGNGKDLIGNFGFGKLYMNEAQYFGSKFNTVYERVFSPHTDYETFIQKKTNNDLKTYTIGHDDTFKNYFNYVVGNIKNNKTKMRDEFYRINKEYLKYLK